MPRTTGPQKSDRILRFLIALRDDSISGPLVAAGFGDADLKEGWSLLRKLGPTSVADAELPAVNEAELALGELEKWARRYIRVLEPAVARKHPKLHEFLYESLPALTRPAVVAAVHVFLERVGQLRKQPGGVAVRELLATRGLTDATIAGVRLHLAKAMGEGMDDKLPKPRKRPDYAAAERAAWAWYLDWTATARATIADGRVLRRLGFAGRTKRTSREPVADTG